MDITTATALPLPLPFDDDVEEPVGFSLTPRARREVAPGQLPPLRLVTRDPVAPHAVDPTDVRPAQARALRRSGMPVTTIAAAIGIDPQLVVAWTEGTAPLRRSGRGRVAGTARAAGPGAVQARQSAAPSRTGSSDRTAVGMAVALAELDERLTGVGFTHGRLEVLAAIVAELRLHLALDGQRMRVAMRVAERRGVDRCRAVVAAALDVPTERIVAGRWVDAPDDEAMEVSVRVTDTAAARLVRGWVDGAGATCHQVLTVG
jgi:lambda repressor-like predicted transcriptional regulator